MKKALLLLTVLLAVGGGAYWLSQRNRVVQPADYAAYLNPAAFNAALRDVNEDLRFWGKSLARDPENNVFLAQKAKLLTTRFGLSHRLDDVLAARRLFEKANARLDGKDVGLLYSLAQNAVTCHRFGDALAYHQQAFRTDNNPRVTNLLLSDVALELGQPDEARARLQMARLGDTFHAQIRQAKYLDFQGDLTGAIGHLEAAFDKVKTSNNPALYCWALSNLGDFYGHANRVNDAYTAYLGVLRKDPTQLYSLRGIAWLAFSHDHNVPEARRILNFLTGLSHDPMLQLDLAQLADFEGNEAEKRLLQRQFAIEVSRPEFGAMYNKYLVNLYADDLNQPADALRLARDEVAHRPTPMTYDLLAWATLKNGNAAEAYRIARQRVAGQTTEPEALAHLSGIYAAVGKTAEADAFRQKARESAFELGPNRMRTLE